MIRWRAVKRYPGSGSRGAPAGERHRVGASVLESLGQDVRFGLKTTFRAMRRRPSFFAFAALIIGLGVAAAGSVFSVMNALLLRPLPFEEPDRLVWVARSTGGGMSNVTSRTSTRLAGVEDRSDRGAAHELEAPDGRLVRYIL